MPGVAVNAGQFHLSLDLSCFKRSSLCVNALIAQRCQRGDGHQRDAAVRAGGGRAESRPLNLSTPYPITLRRVALNNVNIKIDDTTVSVMDFPTGLRSGKSAR